MYTPPDTHISHISPSTTSSTAVEDVPKENEEPEDSESEDDFVAIIVADDDPIPSSGDEFDD